MQKVKKFISYYGPYKAIFYLDMFCALVLSIIDLVFPMLVQYLLDEVYGKRPPAVDIILISGLGLLVLYIIRYFCQRYITAQGHIMGARMETDMRRDLLPIFRSFHFHIMMMPIQES